MSEQTSEALGRISPSQTTAMTDRAIALRAEGRDIISLSVGEPDFATPDHVVAAAKAGKHLIIEKPISLSLADAHRVSAAVKAAGVKTCVCFECRYSSQLVATKAVIDSGLLGKLHYGEVDYYHGIGPWYGQFRWNTSKELGGSSLLSAGCHALDALLLCMGSATHGLPF